jgi:hypothetical protein
MSYTTTQLADAVLKHLAVADASETPDTADRTHVTDVYAQVWEELAAHGLELVYWPADEIPQPVFLTMRDLVALEVQGAFGRPISPAEKEQQREVILRKLRRHVSMQSANKQTRAVYF